MKILIKSHNNTIGILKTGNIGNHISGYHNFLHRDIWRKQGHQVKFIGEKLIPDNWQDYDVLFFRGYHSFRDEWDFSMKILREFKGKKILYLEGGTEKNIGDYFDTVFIPEVPVHLEKWKKEYPNLDVRPIAWTCPEFKLLDNVTNPYPDKKFRLIYTGIYNDRHLNLIRKLAEKGEHIVLGGIYYDGKVLKGLTDEDVKNLLHPNIQLLNDTPLNKAGKGIFTFGNQFAYLKHADCALGFYPYNMHNGSLSSKLTEFLCCGLPVVCDTPMPNGYRVLQYNAGLFIMWDDFDSLYNQIQEIKKLNYDKKQIMDKAKFFHNPDKICIEILT